LENIAEKYLQNKLTAPSAKELEFKGVLLYLANDDIVGASQALKKYLNNDPTFESTRQHKFCVGLIKSINDSDLPLFSDECYKFNEIIPFDKWKTTVLTKIKSRIP
jgi:alpha-soluble NSF attachment protein